jgi:hypothetical protein
MWIVCDILRVVVPRWRGCVKAASEVVVQELGKCDSFLFQTPDVVVTRLLSQKVECCCWLVGCDVSSSATGGGARAQAAGTNSAD